VCKRALAPLHPTPPRRARAACTMHARDGCVQTEWVAALRCTFIGRICALAVTRSARTASLGPIGLSASASGAIPWSRPPICAAHTFTIGRPSSSNQDGDDADGPKRVVLEELEEVLAPVMILADRMGRNPNYSTCMNIMRVHTTGLAEPRKPLQAAEST
ncbi:hypothetical protein T492DRAFT_966202, partial [Pavlovales sp. CCMP2436]